MPNLYIWIFLLALANSTVYYTYLWQLKEYRWDRMRDFLSYKSGWERVLPWYYLLRLIILIGLGAALLGGLKITELEFGKALLTDVVLGYCAFGWAIDLIEAFYRIIRRRYFRPDKTVKALLIMGGSFSLALLAWGWINWPIWMGEEKLFIDWSKWFWLNLELLLVPVIVSLVVAAFYPITVLMKERLMKKAKAKLAKFKDLKVIGITGSYGKSSTKEFLSKILEEKYRVLATPGNTNTDVGVAGVVLKSLKNDTEVFIVEMGAYKIGEIKKICDLVKPQIGIVTAVKDAHLALFGSLENVKKAKYELISGLSQEGKGIFNLDNEGSADLYQRAKKDKIQTLGYAGFGEKESLQAKNIVVEEEKLSFEIDGVKFEANVFGKQNLPNLLGAIAAAQALGMDLPEIAKGVKKIKIIRKTMNLTKASDKIWIIDDTYNANPDGVMAALDYLSIFEKRAKLIVFPGMLELGPHSEQEHLRVARKISQVCDFAIFTSKDFEKPLLTGLGENFNKNKYCFIVNDQSKVLDVINNEIEGRPAVLLFISRGADQVIKKLMQTK